MFFEERTGEFPEFEEAFIDYQLGQLLISCNHLNPHGWELYNHSIRLFPAPWQAFFKIPQKIEEIAGKKIVIISPPDYRPIINGAEHPEFRFMMGGYEGVMATMLKGLEAFSPQHVTLLVQPRMVELFDRSFKSMHVYPAPPLTDLFGHHHHIAEADFVFTLTQLGLYPELLPTFNKPEPVFVADPDLSEYYTEALRLEVKGRIPLAVAWEAHKISGAVGGKSIASSDFFATLDVLKDKFAFIDMQYFIDEQTQKDTDRHVKELRKKGGIFINDFGGFSVFNNFEATAALLTAIKNNGGAAFMVANYTECLANMLGVPGLKPLHFRKHFNYGLGRGFGEDSISRHPWVTPLLQEAEDDWASVIETSLNLLADYNPALANRFANAPKYDFAKGKNEYLASLPEHLKAKLQLDSFSFCDISEFW